MCASNVQYVDKLCRLGILEQIRSYMEYHSTLVQENALSLLSYIILQYGTSSKIFSKSQQFENAIRQSLIQADFVSLLVKVAIDPNSTTAVLRYAFTCFYQLTTSISFSNDDCLNLLLAANSYLLTTVRNYHSSLGILSLFTSHAFICRKITISSVPFVKPSAPILLVLSVWLYAIFLVSFSPISFIIILIFVVSGLFLYFPHNNWILRF